MTRLSFGGRRWWCERVAPQVSTGNRTRATIKALPAAPHLPRPYGRGVYNKRKLQREDVCLINLSKISRWEHEHGQGVSDRDRSVCAGGRSSSRHGDLVSRPA